MPGERHGRLVEYAPQALDDLGGIFDLIAADSGPARAEAYVMRIERRCELLDHFPRAGREMRWLRRGLRVLGFERRVVIAYVVRTDRVVVQRVLYGGRVVVAG